MLLLSKKRKNDKGKGKNVTCSLQTAIVEMAAQ
jgi:hypothetical protein